MWQDGIFDTNMPANYFAKRSTENNLCQCIFGMGPVLITKVRLWIEFNQVVLEAFTGETGSKGNVAHFAKLILWLLWEKSQVALGFEEFCSFSFFHVCPEHVYLQALWPVFPQGWKKVRALQM